MTGFKVSRTLARDEQVHNQTETSQCLPRRSYLRGWRVDSYRTWNSRTIHAAQIIKQVPTSRYYMTHRHLPYDARCCVTQRLARVNFIHILVVDLFHCLVQRVTDATFPCRGFGQRTFHRKRSTAAYLFGGFLQPLVQDLCLFCYLMHGSRKRLQTYRQLICRDTRTRYDRLCLLTARCLAGWSPRQPYRGCRVFGESQTEFWKIYRKNMREEYQHEHHSDASALLDCPVFLR